MTDLGPKSLLWRYAGDTRIAFMGGTIGLLQLMHPAIGRGVLDHSNFFDDPSDRVFRSLPKILGAIYDEDPTATGREVRDYHKPIKGTLESGEAYHALDPSTFWWAHATFQFMAEQVVDRFDRHRLTRTEREQMYQEGVEWFRRYGVSERAVPASRRDFQVEWDRVCAEDLEMNEAVEFVIRLLHQRLPRFDDKVAIPSPIKAVMNTRQLRALISRPSRIVAIGGLPSAVRDRFDIPWSRRDQLELDAIELAVKNSWFLVPDSVKWQPAALAGWKRVKRERHAARSAA